MWQNVTPTTISVLSSAFKAHTQGRRLQNSAAKHEGSAQKTPGETSVLEHYVINQWRHRPLVSQQRAAVQSPHRVKDECRKQLLQQRCETRSGPGPASISLFPQGRCTDACMQSLPRSAVFLGWLVISQAVPGTPTPPSSGFLDFAHHQKCLDSISFCSLL